MPDLNGVVSVRSLCANLCLRASRMSGNLSNVRHTGRIVDLKKPSQCDELARKS